MAKENAIKHLLTKFLSNKSAGELNFSGWKSRRNGQHEIAYIISDFTSQKKIVKVNK